MSNASERKALPLGLLDELCGLVDLYRAKVLPKVPMAPEPPDGVALWEGQYACIALWPVPETSEEQLRLATARAQDWVDAILGETERRIPTRVIDGYLILALPCTPGDELNNQILGIELSTQVCRKHVIWPGDGSSSVQEREGGQKEEWARLMSVTALGLPPPGSPAVPGSNWPNLPADAANLWKSIEAFGYRPTAKMDLEDEAE